MARVRTANEKPSSPLAPLQATINRSTPEPAGRKQAAPPATKAAELESVSPPPTPQPAEKSSPPPEAAPPLSAPVEPEAPPEEVTLPPELPDFSNRTEAAAPPPSPAPSSSPPRTEQEHSMEFFSDSPWFALP